MTEFYIGKREKHSIGAETTYGTETSSYEFGFKNAVFEPTKDQGWQEVPGTGADSVDISYEIGPKLIGGTLTFAPQDWRWLKFVTGRGSTDIVDAALGGGFYSHTATNHPDLKPFSYERFFQHTTAAKEVYKGGQVNTATMTWDAGTGEGAALMKVAINCLWQDMTPTDSGASSNGVAAPSTAIFQFRNCLLTLNTTAQVNLVGGSFVWNNHLSDGRYADYNVNRLKAESGVQRRTYTGTFRMHMKDRSIMTLWNNGVVIPGTNTLVFRRATNDEVAFTFTNLRLKTHSDPTVLNGNNVLTVDWAADSVTWVAKDEIATY